MIAALTGYGMFKLVVWFFWHPWVLLITVMTVVGLAVGMRTTVVVLVLADGVLGAVLVGLVVRDRKGRGDW